MSYTYKNIACSQMSAKEVADCARLFSENYGIWSSKSESKLRGNPIRLSTARFEKMFVKKANRYAAMMFDDGVLIGQVLYMRCDSPWHSDRKITFVQQLVIRKDYRGQRLGLKMLQAVFGFSGDDAWGLYTSNPLTIKALEDATFRHVSIEKIRQSLPELKEVLSDVFDGTEWLDSFRNGCVDTKFHVGHARNPAKIKKAYPDGSFPFKEPLREGEEYLAVIFNTQPVDVSSAVLHILTETSSEILNSAYSKMEMKSQKWAAYAKEEVDALFAQGWVKAGDRVLDFGCGTGRHAIELARRGCIVKGVDFSSRLIEIASNEAKDVANATFEVKDILKFSSGRKYDVVLCLYEVLGSSISPDADARVVGKIWDALAVGGRAIVSVMNLEMTRRYCRRADNTFSDINTREDFMKLVRLPPSCAMQKTGEIFKGQLLLLNPDTGVVYRKEQFVEEADLPREYIIADRRYTAEGLKNLFRKFEPMDLRYVRAGHFEERLLPDERHAKEIFGVFRKRGFLDRLQNRCPTKRAFS